MTYEQLVTITTSNHAKDDMKRLECALAHRELLAGKQNLQQLCADERMRIFCSQKEALHGKP